MYKIGENITITQAFTERLHFIDVRSPSEYAEYHLPHAKNLPIFSDEERKEVGTLYKQVGKDVAIKAGIEIFSNKMPYFYDQLMEWSKDQVPMVVYCARGGMRSKSIVSTFSALNLPLIQLNGGIRSYRKWIVDYLSHGSFIDKPFIILEGHTGTLKTDILEQLQNDGYPVVDLERMAGHRGSIFGHIGLEPVSQKEFEARLTNRLRELETAPFIIIEGESRRIGKVVLPELFMEKKEQGIRLHVDMPLKERVKNILETYPVERDEAAFEEAINHLSKYLTPIKKEQIFETFYQKEYDVLVEDLLMSYYDPRYSYKINDESQKISFFYKSFSEGYGMIKNWLDEYLLKKSLTLQERGGH